MVLTFESVDEILKCPLIQMKATEHYFPVVLFILYEVNLTFDLWMKCSCDHSTESYQRLLRTVLFCAVVYHSVCSVKGTFLNFLDCE